MLLLLSKVRPSVQRVLRMLPVLLDRNSRWVFLLVVTQKNWKHKKIKR